MISTMPLGKDQKILAMAIKDKVSTHEDFVNSRTVSCLLLKSSHSDLFMQNVQNPCEMTIAD